MAFTQHIPCGAAGEAETQSWIRLLSAVSGEAKLVLAKNIKSAYRLSVVGSVAPPGTAWDAEGLRGNEANENNLMVLAREKARKWQSGRVLHNGHRAASGSLSAVRWIRFARGARPWLPEGGSRTPSYAPLETSRAQF